jgi:hypothetical protein
MTDIDSYDIYYARRLWELLPAVYRTDDTNTDGSPGPLHEMLNRIGAQVAVVRRSLDRLWADQSIETCDDWLIPYIADLLGTNLINGLDAPAQRLDVANTIHYRRRKGTLAVLEELARTVTGWDACVVEGFRRLARTRHSLDPMVGGGAFPNASPDDVATLLTAEGLSGALTRTPAGGLADLRSPHGAAMAGSAFDESFHTADMRIGRGALGHFGIPKLLVFLWRLNAFGIAGGTPVAVAGCPDQFVFDPTGREIPLFLPSTANNDDPNPAYDWQVPGRITAGLQQAMAAAASTTPPPPALDSFAYSARLGTDEGVTLEPVWPELGRFQIQPPSPPTSATNLTVDYHYGFSANLGAGPYDRLLLDDPVERKSPTATVKDGTGLDVQLSQLAATGVLEIGGSRTYETLADVGTTAVPIGDEVVVAAAPQQRPVLRPAPASPPAGTAPTWVFTGGGGPSNLTLDGLLISGCDIVLRGSFDKVRITACTLDPGGADHSPAGSPPAATPLAHGVDGRELRPTTIWIEAGADAPPGSPPAASPPESGTGAIGELRIDHSIVGPIRTRYGGSVEKLTISDSIVAAVPATFGPEYTAADVYDPALLVLSLKAQDPLSQALRAALPAAAQTALDTYTAPEPMPQALIDGLNDLVTGPSLWDPTLFAGITVGPDLQALIGAPPSPPSPPSAAVATLNRGLLDAAMPVALGLAAIAVSNARVTLSQVSVLGDLAVHRLWASNSILTGFTCVDDTQEGCVRFSAYVGGSPIPRQYESVTIGAGAFLFTSTDYGNPGYCQLLEAADAAITGGAGATITAGADNSSEMGAFSSGLAPIRQQGLVLKYAEYMPLGLTPVIVHVT